MTTEQPAISAAGWLERLGQLAVRQGVHLSTLQQKDGRDLELVFASATLFFPADKLLDERGANTVLKQFLSTAGAMLDTDHVELRRWLVDTGFVRRSDFGSDYRRGTLPAWLDQAAAGLGPHRGTRRDSIRAVGGVHSDCQRCGASPWREWEGARATGDNC